MKKHSKNVVAAKIGSVRRNAGKIMKQFFKMLRDHARAQLGKELFEKLSITMDKIANKVCIQFKETIDGLDEAVARAVEHVIHRHFPTSAKYKMKERAVVIT